MDNFKFINPSKNRVYGPLIMKFNLFEFLFMQRTNVRYLFVSTLILLSMLEVVITDILMKNMKRVLMKLDEYMI